MARFLTTLPVNYGFYNLGTVQAYPTGGSGPTAYGPTNYFGSDPLPPRIGDNINNPIDLGNFASLFKTITISNTHGGLSRIQSTFYHIRLLKPRGISFTQNFSQTSYESNTNRNTIVSIYRIEDGNRRRELPINDDGFVYSETGIPYNDSYTDEPTYVSDYPSTVLAEGSYIILITNDIRFLETTYSIGLSVVQIDWRYVAESVDESSNFALLTDPVDLVFDCGSLTV